MSVLLIGALLSLKTARSHKGSKQTIRLVIAGACCGAATLTEYQALIPSIFFTVYVLMCPELRTTRCIAAFILPAVPFAGALLAYNYAAFGHVFSLSYEHLAHATYRKIHGKGIAGVTMPSAQSFGLWFLSLRRGLFITSPVFALAPVGLFLLVLRRQWADTFVIGGIVLFFFLFLSSTHIWPGDWGFGPRLAVPALGIFCAHSSGCAEHWTVGHWADCHSRGAYLGRPLYAIYARVFPRTLGQGLESLKRRDHSDVECQRRRPQSRSEMDAAARCFESHSPGRFGCDVRDLFGISRCCFRSQTRAGHCARCSHRNCCCNLDQLCPAQFHRQS